MALQQMETVGCADALVAQGIKMPDLLPLNGSGQAIAHVDLTGTLAKYTKYPFALLIAQVRAGVVPSVRADWTPECDVEAILGARLAALGQTIHRERRVARMDDAPDGLVVVLEDGATVRAKHVVGADGARSQARLPMPDAFR